MNYVWAELAECKNARLFRRGLEGRYKAVVVNGEERARCPLD